MQLVLEEYSWQLDNIPEYSGDLRNVGRNAGKILILPSHYWQDS